VREDVYTPIVFSINQSTNQSINQSTNQIGPRSGRISLICLLENVYFQKMDPKSVSTDLFDALFEANADQRAPTCPPNTWMGVKFGTGRQFNLRVGVKFGPGRLIEPAGGC